MKKLFLTTAIALLAFTGLGVSQVAHAQDQELLDTVDASDIWKAYTTDPNKIPCTFIALKIKFGYTENTVTHVIDDRMGPGDFIWDWDFNGVNFGIYRGPEYKYEKGVRYQLVSQKIYGTHTPNAFVTTRSEMNSFLTMKLFKGKDLNDSSLDYRDFSGNTFAGEQILQGVDFGYHVSGSELVGTYLRKM